MPGKRKPMAFLVTAYVEVLALSPDEAKKEAELALRVLRGTDDSKIVDTWVKDVSTWGRTHVEPERPAYSLEVLSEEDRTYRYQVFFEGSSIVFTLQSETRLVPGSIASYDGKSIRVIKVNKHDSFAFDGKVTVQWADAEK